MKYFLYLLAILLVILIYKNKGVKRAKCFLLGCFLIPSYFGTGHLLFATAILLSLIEHGEFVNIYKRFPLRNITIVIFVVFFWVAFFDERLHGFQILSVSIITFLRTYVFLFIGFSLVSYHHEWMNTMKFFAGILAVMGIYGAITYIIQENPWYDYFYLRVFGGDNIWGDVQERGYRVNSFLENPIGYGLVMGTGVLSIWAWRLKQAQKKYTWLILIVALNVLLCNSRSSILSFGLMIVIFTFYYYGISNSLLSRIIVFSFVAVAVFVSFRDHFFMIDSSIDVFTSGGENTEGSSIELKEIQLYSSLRFWKEAPYWGHGINYFREVIRPRFANTTGLAGLEGYIFKLLIEYGIFMILAFVTYIVCLFVTVVKAHKKSLLFSSLVLAQFIAFIFHIVAVGDHGNVFEYCLVMIGLNYRRMIEESRIFNIIKKPTYNLKSPYLSFLGT